MIIYGLHAVREALRGRRTVSQIWATESVAKRSQYPTNILSTVSTSEIEQRAGSVHHGGVCALVSEFEYVDGGELLNEDNAFLVVLDEINDPQNFGAICRTCECAGVTGIVIPERRSAQVTPAVCNASAGAVEHLSIAQVRNVADFLEEAKKSNCWVYGAEGSSRVLYTQPEFTDKTVLVFGSEGKGLRPRVASVCDELISLPLRGSVESLNVNAAAAVMIYEVVRQRS